MSDDPTGRHRAQALDDAVAAIMRRANAASGRAVFVDEVILRDIIGGALAAAETPCDNCASLKRHLEETTAHWVDAETRAKDRLGELQELQWASAAPAPAEAPPAMRLHCYFCGKSVSTEVPTTTIVRALCVCPECIEAGKVGLPKEDGHGR